MSQSQSLPEPHDLALEFPEMPEAEFRELVEDIRNNGLREMITELDGKILDGRHRAKALVELGWPLEEYCEHFDTSCGDPVEYVISRNVRRRHLTAKERVAIVLKLYETKGKKRISEPKTDDRRDIETGKKVSQVVENQGKRQLSHPPTTDVTVREIAKAANVSTRTVERYKAEQAGRPVG